MNLNKSRTSRRKNLKELEDSYKRINSSFLSSKLDCKRKLDEQHISDEEEDDRYQNLNYEELKKLFSADSNVSSNLPENESTSENSFQNICDPLSYTNCSKKAKKKRSSEFFAYENDNFVTTEKRDNNEVLSEKTENFLIDEDIFDESQFTYRYSDDSDSDSDDENDQKVFVDGDVVIADALKNELKLDNVLHTISNSFISILSSWSVHYRIRQRALNNLLKNIREKIPALKLPLDARTLVKTPRGPSETIEIAGGKYCHFGVKQCIEKIVIRRTFSFISDTSIDLLINSDGAPIGKSSEKNLWPILCSDKLSKDVFIIGIFCGDYKPNDVNAFLRQFVEEIITIINVGIIINKITYKVNFYALVCDSPAKAFLLCVKYHSGYYSCTKCVKKGKYYRSVCFPGDVDSLRTDENFRLNKYENYQTGETILKSIPNLGLVTGVPLDSMHSVYLGCTRRKILLLIDTKSPAKLPNFEIEKISNLLVSFRSYIPYEFNRKPRSLKFIKLFKATEFRLLLLYILAVVLQGIVSSDIYYNFLTLHVAITVLSCADLVESEFYVNYAEKLLSKFVKDFEKIYGPDYVSFNIHTLLHLADDVRKYGVLENFSAFHFEDCIGFIKSLIRTGNKTVEQIDRRCKEISQFENELLYNKSKKKIELLQNHSKGPLIENFKTEIQYKVIEFKNFKLNCDDEKNNCILINKKIIFNALNFIKNYDNEIFVIGKRMKILGNLYTHPLPSSKIGINVVCTVNKNPLESWNIKNITCKLMKLPYKNNYCTFRILHTVNNVL